jgi:hypothetical protein
LALVAGIASAMCGCSAKTPDRVAAPAIDPSAMAAKAMALYDTNKDGVLSGDELNKCPAIKTSIKLFSSGDGKVTADSIAAELQKMKDSKVGIMSLIANVKLDGAELEGAKVQLEPEPFMAGAISSASGMTNAKGSASLVIDSQGGGPRGANPGLYKVRITKQVNGHEIISARYNTDTELGIDVAQDNLDLMSQLRFDLKSR